MVVYVGVGAMRVEHPIIMEGIGSWFDGCPDLLPRGLRVICCHVAFHFDEVGGGAQLYQMQASLTWHCASWVWGPAS